jgi:hypothetical protein
LVTSRNQTELANLYFGTGSIDLDVLSVEEAATLARRLFQKKSRNLSGETYTRIAKKLHCFPLAIAQMASVSQLRGLWPEEFLSIYEDELQRHRLHNIQTGQYQAYRQTLSSVWALHNFADGPKSILHILALLNPDSISQEIFTTDPKVAKLPGFPASEIEVWES